MKMSEYAEKLASESFFDEYIDEAYWSHDFKTEKCLKMLKDDAESKGFSLTDEEDFNYDKFFFELYKSTEKGLS